MVVVDAELVRAHQTAVWRYLRVLGAAAADADDLTQEAFVVLAQAGLPDRGPAELRGWLRSTARNLWRNDVRRRARRGETLPPEQIDAAWAVYERQDDGESYRAALRACLETLPARERQAIDARYARAERRDAIAAAADVGVEGIKSLLRRAKARLRACIERRLDDGD
jgi:RNA polymerase sigma-70 factor (ECF subfamily)